MLRSLRRFGYDSHPTRPSSTSICLSSKPLQLVYTETLQGRAKDGVLQSPKCYRYQITSTDYKAHSNFARLKIFDISGINVFLFTFLDFRFVIFSVLDLAVIHNRSGMLIRNEQESKQCAVNASGSTLWGTGA